MNQQDEYDELFARANARIREHFADERNRSNASEAAHDALQGLKRIRDATSEIMGTNSAMLAQDILQCVANEVRRLTIQRRSDADFDSELFAQCRDDKNAYDYIEDWAYIACGVKARIVGYCERRCVLLHQRLWRP